MSWQVVRREEKNRKGEGFHANCFEWRRAHDDTYQVSYVGNLNGIMNNFGSCASISLIKHCFVDDNGCFDIFGCITDISLISASAICVLMVYKARQVLLLSAPCIAPVLQCSIIRAAFILLCLRLEDYMRMFLYREIENVRNERILSIKKFAYIVSILIWSRRCVRSAHSGESIHSNYRRCYSSEEQLHSIHKGFTVGESTNKRCRILPISLHHKTDG